MDDSSPSRRRNRSGNPRPGNPRPVNPRPVGKGLDGGRHSRPLQRSRAFRRTRALLLLACTAILAVALGAGIHSAVRAGAIAAPEPGSVTGGQGAAPASNAGAVPAALAEKINAVITANSDYQIGVALLDLSEGADASATAQSYGVDEAFVAASTAKILAAEAYYHLVETGEASLDDPLGAYTSGFQLKAMVQQSDNDSWLLIMDAVGYEELTEYAASIGVDYAPESNKLTPADMARTLAGLYSGTLLNPGNTAELLSYMQDTNYEDLIPAATPAGISVFHKYGLLDEELHDAGILAKDGAAYALVVYTKGESLASVPERTEAIQEVTEAVVESLF